ncbi:DUF732 domain-containing protein [Streptomyces xanthochromogenes]|uniref:DUF732 domain-containing protein n=1 Tax=Streptomyces xanthochromogenes TaxID=67384 RepID=UPI0037A35642
MYGRREGPGVKPGVIVPEGHEVCDMLTADQTVDDAASKIRLGFSDKAAGAIIGAAPALCPAYSAKNRRLDLRTPLMAIDLGQSSILTARLARTHA